jgi:CDP-diacylglycerol--serine O-phosphatidyltransferase
VSPRLKIWRPVLLPNLLTTINLLAGYFAIIQVINHDFSRAAWAIFVAAVMDGLDGMAARMTHSTSTFGLEFDSLADCVSFGIAPSLFMYLWLLRPYGRIGWVAAFLFVACGVLRLARFNVQSHDVQKFFFLGIPIPMAAAQVVTSYFMITHLEATRPRTASLLLLATAYLTAFLMISSIPYRSLKSVSVRRRYSFYIPVLFIVTSAVILIHPPFVLWGMSTAYLLSGPVEFLYHKAFPKTTPGRFGEHWSASHGE